MDRTYSELYCDTNRYVHTKCTAYNAVVFLYSGPKLIILWTLCRKLMAKLYSDMNMYAYTNYTSYDVKLFIYVQGLNSRYFEHYWEDL